MSPILQLSESQAEAAGGLTPISDVLVSEDTGELSLEAQVISDFLTHVDFSAVWDVETAVAEAEEFELDGEDGKQTIQVMPGFAVGAAIDEADVFELFVHYVGQLADSAETLEDKAHVAAFADLLDLDEAPNKKGAMRRKQKGGPKKRNSVVRQMLAMVHKGVITRTADGYKKGKGYKKGGTKPGKMKVAKYAKKNAGKIKRAAKKAGSTGESSTFFTPFDFAQLEEYAEWGQAAAVGTILYQVALDDNAEARVTEMGMKFGKKFGKAKKGGTPKPGAKKGMDYSTGHDESAGSDDFDEEVTETTKRNVSLAKGIIGLHEGTVRITRQISESAKKGDGDQIDG